MAAGFVDVHHHLLHGMDDGPGTFEQTICMIHQMVEQGVTFAAATPHMQPGIVEFDPALYGDHLAMAQAYIREQGLNLQLAWGAEVYYTSSTPRYLQQEKIPLLGNGWHVLLEFHPHESYDAIRRAVLSVCNAGFGVVLAHAERYRALCCGDRLAHLKERCHLKVQVNGDTILRSHRGLGGGWVRRMIKAGVVDLVASDAHDMQARPCTMKACAQLLSRVYGQSLARKLCIDQPLALLTEKNGSTWMKNTEEGIL